MRVSIAATSRSPRAAPTRVEGEIVPLAGIVTLRATSAIVLLLLLAGSPLPASGQAQAAGSSMRVELGVEPEEVTVGEPFYVAMRVVAPPEIRIEYGEFEDGDTLQALEPLHRTATPNGDEAVVYSLVAWVAGVPLSASVPVRIVEADGTTRTQNVSLQLPVVASVLPAEEEALAPRPPKGLFVPPLFAAFPWWWLALLLGALLAALLAYWLLRRPRPEELLLPVDPREWALAQLDPRWLDATLRAGELDALYRHLSRVVRTYLHRVRGDLGQDLTTTELLARFDAGDVDADLVRALGDVLFAADRVKFARYGATAAEGRASVERARDWIRAYPPPVAEADDERRAA